MAAAEGERTGPTKTFLSERKFDILIAVLVLIGCVFCACSLLLPNWTEYVHSGTTDTYHYGLYMTCVEKRSGRLCIATHLDKVSGAWNVVVKIFGSLGGVAYVLTFGAAFLAVVQERESKRWYLLATIVMATVTFVLSLITIGVYVGVHNYLDGTYDFAFYFAIVSLLLVVCSIPLALYRRRTYTWKDEADDSDVTSQVSVEMPYLQEREVTISLGPSNTTMRDPRVQRFIQANQDLGDDKARWNEDDSSVAKNKIDESKEEENDDSEEKKEKKKRRKKRKSKKLQKAYKNIQEATLTKVNKLDEL